MRKKIINGLLLAVTFVAMSALVSCKDYAEDYYAELKGQIADQDLNLQTLQTGQISTLNTAIANLQTQLGALQTNGATLADLQHDIDSLATKLRGEMQTLNNCDCKADRDRLHKSVDSIKVVLDQKVDLLTVQTLLQAAIDSLAKVEKADSLTLATAIEKANQQALAATALATQANGLATRDSIRIDGLDEVIDSIRGALVVIDNRLTQVEKDATEALALAIRDSIRLDAVEKGLEAALARLTDAEADIDQLQKDLEQAQKDIEQNAKDLAEAKEKYDNALKVINEALASLQKQINDLYDTNEEIKDQVDLLTSRIEALESKVVPGYDDTELQNEIKDLKDRVKALEDGDYLTMEQVQAYVTPIVNALESKIKAVEDDIDDLKKRLNKYIEDVSNQIKNIILQGAESPVVGYFALPVGIQSNILAAYYGEPLATNSSDQVEFPTDRPALYVFSDEVITDKAFQVIGGKGVITKTVYDNYIMDESEGNAGTLYLTINPAEKDFSGITPKLVDSRDNESGITLSAITPSAKTLYFGATRAQRVYNGFYEAKATVDPAKIKDIKPHFELDNLKPLAKQILNREIELTNIYYTIQDQVKDVLVRNGVKVEWTDTLGDHSVYSDYSIAATAIPALSYKFLSDGIDKKIPYISPIGALTIDVEIKLNNAVVNDPTPLKKLDYDPFEIWVDLNHNDAKDEGEIFTGKGLEEFNKVIDQINKDMKTITGEIKQNVDDLIKEIKNQVNDNMNNVEDDMNERFIDKVNDVIAKVNKVIKRINKYFQNPNYFLQPFLAYQKADGAYDPMSEVPVIPTEFVFNGGTGIELIPTSFTAETLAPAFQKFIAVTDVISPDGTASAQEGDATCQALADYANKEANYMKTVIPGKQTGVVFAPDPDKKGYTYEITYAALDHNGYNVAKKFYVRVK